MSNKSIFKIFSFIVLFLITQNDIFSQSSYALENEENIHIVDRTSILTPHDSLFYSQIRPYKRREIVEQNKLRENDQIKLNSIELNNLKNINMTNIEYDTNKNIYNKKAILKYFYKNRSEFYGVHIPDFDLSINPVIQYQQYFEKTNGDPIFLNQRGVQIKGILANRLSFQTIFTDNQERGTLALNQYFNKYNALQGEGYVLPFKTNYGFDYLEASSNINFKVIKKYVDVTAGFDRNFIGNGYRSLFLSDNSPNYLFGKINTKIWKLNYTNYYMEMIPYRTTTDMLLPRKYAVMNYLSSNIKEWLNFGFFEGVVMGRKDHFDIMYVAPIMFLRSSERNIGSDDNAVMGFDFKINIKKRLQFYSQILFDEFKFKELITNKNSFFNKNGIQLGAKYINVFGIQNLDIQGEINMVRPYTYSHYNLIDSLYVISAYTHYNQPLAHPLGSNFKEYIALLFYQPTKNILIKAKSIFSIQGLDYNGINYGGNPNITYVSRPVGNEYPYFQGLNTKTMYNELMISYSFLPNCFIDFTSIYRIQKNEVSDLKNKYFTLGLRMNGIFRRYDY